MSISLKENIDEFTGNYTAFSYGGKIDEESGWLFDLLYLHEKDKLYGGLNIIISNYKKKIKISLFDNLGLKINDKIIYLKNSYLYDTDKNFKGTEFNESGLYLLDSYILNELLSDNKILVRVSLKDNVPFDFLINEDIRKNIREFYSYFKDKIKLSQ